MKRSHRFTWQCERVARQYKKISNIEMRQRLAELVEVLLRPKCQLPIETAFSKDSLNRESTFTKRKDSA